MRTVMNNVGGQTAMKQVSGQRIRNRPTYYDGVRYDSRAEAERAAELDMLVQQGTFRLVVRQPTFRLGCAENVYRPDFLVIARYGHVWCEDVKGVETAKFRRDRKLWAAYGRCPLKIMRRHRRGSTGSWAVEHIAGGNDAISV